MRNKVRTIMITAVVASALAACGDDTKLDERIVDGETPGPVEEAVTVFEPLKRTYTLRPEQQERRDAMNLDEFQKEYGGYRDEITAAGGAEAAKTGDATATPGASGLRPRGEMDFAYLDRNGDGKLSIAEYAVWAVPMEPGQAQRSDKSKPYLTPDEANRTANSFTFYDMDGDGFLQPGEYAVFTARKQQ